MLAPVSKYLADLLKEHVDDIPEIGRDAKKTVQRLEKVKLPKDFVFLTFDVEACYPSINVPDAINILSRHISWMKHVDNGLWRKLLEMVMYKNFVTANGKTYQQKVGTATGTQVAPPFANMYLYYKYKKALENDSIILQERFIDDGFLIVKTEEDAKKIMEDLLLSSNLNLTWNISTKSAIYLDLNIYKAPLYRMEKKLDLKVYFKPTNRLLYLPASSNHPSTIRSGIVRGEAIRTLRNTNNKGDWLESLRIIFKGLMARGYDPDTIKKKWKTVKFEEREYYVNSHTEKNKLEGTLIQTTYNPKTSYWWKKLLATYTIENIFWKKRDRYNTGKMKILDNWPPIILWMDFDKVARHTINANAQWK